MSRIVKIGNVVIGGGNPIAIQSMTNTDTKDVDATVKQIKELASAGCHIVRMAVKDKYDAEAVKAIKNEVPAVPLVADIHFDYRLALAAMENGIDKIRINPGNIGDEGKVKLVADEAKRRSIPIRIGINSGSLEKHLLMKYGHPTPEAMVASAMFHVRLLEKYGFEDIVISLKSSNVKTMYDAYVKMSENTDYPLHLGVTEAGTMERGSIKSAMGIGGLLLRGIGDTIRVSLTENPVEEIGVAKTILKVAGYIDEGVDIVSCPTCGRTEIDLIGLAKQVEKEFKDKNYNIDIAVMGCVVNGPGEAREADYGIAGGKQVTVLFKKGQIIKKVAESEALEELKKMIEEDMQKK
ncbi:flavodoxin-dependent (E)-4-hydroxy-3-methylbut-2-enyl-diphosphate synthase [Sebaldella termitidis]|uniref:flavodoxin-dependent (E)-4-hydroxy-3-methylbut-2-enyl-diphosphate synthase n=1 Tax=Sebaldella termitidis TaxID=826 RepID=UPI003EBA9C2D